MQSTISQIARFRGVGLHSGEPTCLAINPAPAGHGIVFRRTDLPGKPTIPALWNHVVPTPLCTRLETEDGAAVSTVEHVMAALAGTGVHNALIDLDGPEVPILDGSSRPFVQGILRAGLRKQGAPLRVIRVLRPVTVGSGSASETLSPAEHLEIDFAIDFDEPAIGRQHKRLDMANGSFVTELMDSRTFCRQSDVAAMQARGQALGGTYFNAVVVDGARVLTPGGLRHPDEPVRHKMLDAMGDLALAGAPLLARLTAVRGGHAMTNQLLRALFADPTAYRWEVSAPALAARLPGAGLDLHHDLAAAQGQRAFASA